MGIDCDPHSGRMPGLLALWQLVITLSHTTTSHLDGGCPSPTEHVMRDGLSAWARVARYSLIPDLSLIQQLL